MSFSNMYRPSTYSDLVFSSQLTARIVKQYADCKRSGHLILSGPHGTGKSTIARIIQKDRQVFQGVQIESYAVNGSLLNAKYEAILLGQLNIWLGHSEKMPCWIIEEADCIPKAYRAGFQQFLDDWSHLAFAIMTTNHLKSIPSGIRSRSENCDVQCMPAGYWLPHLRTYLASINVSYSNQTLLSLLRKKGNAIRDAEKLADTLTP